MEKKDNKNENAVSVAVVWTVECGRCAGAKGNSSDQLSPPVS